MSCDCRVKLSVFVGGGEGRGGGNFVDFSII